MTKPERLVALCAGRYLLRQAIDQLGFSLAYIRILKDAPSPSQQYTQMLQVPSRALPCLYLYEEPDLISKRKNAASIETGWQKEREVAS